MAITTQVVQEREQVHHIKLENVFTEDVFSRLQNGDYALVDGNAVCSLLNNRGNCERERGVQFRQDNRINTLRRT